MLCYFSSEIFGRNVPLHQHLIFLFYRVPIRNDTIFITLLIIMYTCLVSLWPWWQNKHKILCDYHIVTNYLQLIQQNVLKGKSIPLNSQIICGCLSLTHLLCYGFSKTENLKQYSNLTNCSFHLCIYVSVIYPICAIFPMISLAFVGAAWH